MAKSKKQVETVWLVCDETGDYNYTLRRKTGGEKLKLKKFQLILLSAEMVRRNFQRVGNKLYL